MPLTKANPLYSRLNNIRYCEAIAEMEGLMAGLTGSRGIDGFDIAALWPASAPLAAAAIPDIARDLATPDGDPMRAPAPDDWRAAAGNGESN